jgi:hypothetical protein
MKKNNVQLGKVYAVKVSGSVVPVRIDRESPHGGWIGTSMKSRKEVRVKSPQRLRGLWPTRTMPVVEEPEPTTPEEAQAIHHADQENARLDEERRDEPDGQTASERAMTESAQVMKKERPSLLNLAAKVLAEAGEPLSCQQMVERVLATGLWQTEGKTPSATLYTVMTMLAKVA